MDLLLPNNLSLEKAMILEKVISNNITENPPINLHDGGVFKKGVNSKLDSLRDIKNLKQKEILKTLGFQPHIGLVVSCGIIFRKQTGKTFYMILVI